MPQIVHLGFGNFHRAHQAWYTQQAGGWDIIGVSMTRPDLRDALAADHFAYSLVIQSPAGTNTVRMTVHKNVLVLPEAPERVVSAIADPATEIVTVTVTEKGYHYDTSGHLDLASELIQSDLSGTGPCTTVGTLARGLAQRAASQRPITILSCDNLPNNGPNLARAVRSFAHAADLNIATYLDDKTTFPATMVDRITPATTPELRRALGEPAPVLTEAFSEWIIEDRFAGDRPNWTAAGVVFAESVAPYEARKLHILNAAHTLLAYWGLLRGHAYVHEAIADPVLRAAVQTLWGEARNCLPTDIEPTLEAYESALLARFSVAGMKHRLDQIASDGSQKVAVRLAPLIRRGPVVAAAQGVAAWCAYLSGNGQAPDPGADHLRGQSLAQVVPAALKVAGLSDLGLEGDILAFAQGITPGS
jgi:fructuronate reductase